MADTFLHQMGEAVAPTAVALAGWAAAGAAVWFNRRRARRPHRPIEEITRADLEISVILDRALHRIGAQRVYLSQIHNGDAYLGGPDIIRKSRTHERVKDGVAYQQEQFRGVLMSTLPEEAKLVIDHGASFTRVRDLPQSKFRWLCEHAGIRAVARCAIRHDSRTVAFVGADFDTEEKPAEIETLCDDAYRIGQIVREMAP